MSAKWCDVNCIRSIWMLFISKRNTGFSSGVACPRCRLGSHFVMSLKIVLHSTVLILHLICRDERARLLSAFMEIRGVLIIQESKVIVERIERRLLYYLLAKSVLHIAGHERTVAIRPFHHLSDRVITIVDGRESRTARMIVDNIFVILWELKSLFLFEMSRDEYGDA